MVLSHKQQKELQSALIDAFPTETSLEMMLFYELDKSLTVVSGGKNLQEIVFKLIRTAQAEGWIEDLVRAARKSNPKNPILEGFTLEGIQLYSRNSLQKLSFRNSLQQELLNEISTQVESRLSSSLHNRVYIVLDTKLNPDEIELPWSSEIKIGSKPKVHLTNIEITTIYDMPEVAGRLLILGVPGSGKTTILLKLASELVNRAKNDTSYPIPVLFPLSSWKNDSQNIKDWLVDVLRIKYGIRNDIGKQWVNNQEIIPLLDGLDELETERQEKCVIKINEFLNPTNWKNPIVICSRIEEYHQYTNLLQLNNSLELCPFSQEQVAEYLQKTGESQLWNSISHDDDLSQLAQIPLLLNIIILSAQEISIQTWEQFNSSEERLSYLFDAYIRRMLKRKDKQPKFKSENTKRWLSWLAYQLIEESNTEFLIEKIQPDWLKNKFLKLIYNLSFWGLIGSLINGLIWGYYGFINYQQNKIIFGLFNGLIVGLITGLILSLYSEQFNFLIENSFVKKFFLVFNLKYFSKTTIKGLTLGLISGLIYAFYGLIIKLFFGWTDFFIDVFNWDTLSEITLGLIVGLTYGWIGETIQTMESFKISLKNFSKGLKEWIIFGIFFGVFFKLIFVLINVNHQILESNLTKTLFEYLIYDLFKTLLSGLSLGFYLSFLCGCIYGITPNEIINKTYPNQGIRLSIINCIRLFLFFSFFIGLSTFIRLFNTTYILTNQLIINNISYVILIGILIVIPRSGTPVIKHFIVRVILWSSGYIPWNYAKFLNYSTNRLFLQRVGGEYRFIHDLLRQHFAKSYTHIYSTPQTLQEDKFKKILLVVGILILMGYTSWQFNLREATAYVYIYQGFYYEKKNHYTQAITNFNQAIKLVPNSAFSYYNRGLYYHHKKDYEHAIADYNHTIKLDPNYVEAYNNLGEIYNYNKDYDYAISELNKGIKQNPNSAELYNQRGFSYESKKDYEHAIVDYNQAIKLNPNDTYLYKVRGIFYNNKHDYDHAIADYNQAIKQNPNEASLYNKRGISYKKKKDYDHAITDFNQAIKLDPNNSEFYNNRGSSYNNKKEYEHAISDFNQAIKLDPNNSEFYNSRGISYNNKEDYDHAISDFNQAIKLDPNNSEFYNSRGISYNNKEDYDHAINDYNQAIKLDPNNSEFYNNRGNYHYNKKDYEHAISDYNQAIKLDPNNSEFYKSRGDFYFVLKDYDSAITDYNQDIKLDPRSVDSYYKRSICYMIKYDYGSSIADLNQAIELVPNQPTFYYQRGLSYYLKKDYEHAIINFSQVIKLDPKNVSAYYKRAISYYYNNNYTLAIIDYNQVIKLNPNNAEVYYNRGLSYKYKGIKDKAIEDFNKFLKLNNDVKLNQGAKQQLQELSRK